MRNLPLHTAVNADDHLYHTTAKRPLLTDLRRLELDTSGNKRRTTGLGTLGELRGRRTAEECDGRVRRALYGWLTRFTRSIYYSSSEIIYALQAPDEGASRLPDIP